VLRHVEREGERNETLLSAVVNVALDPLALDVSRLHYARPRFLDLAQASAKLRV
jgi:hypothetical protein